MTRSSYLHSIRGNKTHRSKPRCQIIEPALMLIVQIDLLSFAANTFNWQNHQRPWNHMCEGILWIETSKICAMQHNKQYFLKSHKIMTDLAWLSLCTFLILLTFVTSPFIFPFSHFKTDFFVHFQIYYLSFPWFTFFLYFLFYFFQSFSKTFFLFRYRSIEVRFNRNGRFRYCLQGEPYSCS